MTTLLDPEQATKEDLASLYRARWNNELDLRSIKVTMQMDVLRCKTPELVRKEIWTHVLAYNLIRTVMAQAAAKHGGRAAVDQLQGDAADAGGVPAADRLPGPARRGHRAALYQQILRAIAAHRVADRPDRFEPRDDEAQAEELRPPDEAAARDQTRDDQSDLAKSKCHSSDRPKSLRCRRTEAVP